MCVPDVTGLFFRIFLLFFRLIPEVVHKSDNKEKMQCVFLYCVLKAVFDLLVCYCRITSMRFKKVLCVRGHVGVWACVCVCACVHVCMRVCVCICVRATLQVPVFLLLSFLADTVCRLLCIAGLLRELTP